MTQEFFFELTHRYSCAINNVDFDKSFTKSRKRELVDARRLSIHALSEIGNWSHEAIGIFFNRDRTTVLYAKKTSFELLKLDKDYSDNYILLKELIEPHKKNKIEHNEKEKLSFKVLKALNDCENDELLKEKLLELLIDY